MRQVFQSVTEAGKGNALQACVAAMLDLELSAVPDVLADPRGYAVAIEEFLRPLGLSLLKLPLDVNGQLPFATGAATLCLLAGPSPRGSHKHVVVARVAAPPAAESTEAGAEGGATSDAAGSAASIQLSTGFELAHDPFEGGEGLGGPGQWAGFFVKRLED
jgi:hypothetical protein